ncbi:MAG: hypothetical protein M3272_07560 [Actinomycetota bacterium]|nr:hypothetical protein [Actinomycetota bacterium]
MIEGAANGVQAAKVGNMAALGLAYADDEERLTDGVAPRRGRQKLRRGRGGRG